MHDRTLNYSLATGMEPAATVTLTSAGRSSVADVKFFKRRRAVTDFHSAIAFSDEGEFERRNVGSEGGRNGFRTAEKVETNRCNPSQDRNPCIILSRFSDGNVKNSPPDC